MVTSFWDCKEISLPVLRLAWSKCILKTMFEYNTYSQGPIWTVTMYKVTFSKVTKKKKNLKVFSCLWFNFLMEIANYFNLLGTLLQSRSWGRLCLQQPRSTWQDSGAWTDRTDQPNVLRLYNNLIPGTFCEIFLFQ